MSQETAQQVRVGFSVKQHEGLWFVIAQFFRDGAWEIVGTDGPFADEEIATKAGKEFLEFAAKEFEDELGEVEVVRSWNSDQGGET